MNSLDDILQAYQRTRNQARYLELWVKDADGLPDSIRTFAQNGKIVEVALLDRKMSGPVHYRVVDLK